MNKRLLSVGLLMVSLAIGFGLGRALGTDDTPPTTTPPTTTTVPTTTPPTVESTDVPEEAETLAPVLAELVPELSRPLLLEVTNPTRLLRWDPSDPEPRPVTGLPPGSDLTMDRAARFLLTTISTGTSDVLVGGLLDTPLSILSEDLAATPAWADFSDQFWFIQGIYLVRMDIRGEATHFELPQFPASSSGGRTAIALADDDGAVIEQWHTEGGSLVFKRVLIQTAEIVELLAREGSRVVGIDEEVIIIRQPEGDLTALDRSTGLVLEDRSTTCGLSYTESLDTTVCAGAQLLFLEDSHEWEAWTTSRWSGSGRWFMAVGGDSDGRVLLFDTETREVTVVEISLPDGSMLVDVWSGA